MRPDPFALKHRPVAILPYAEHDGPYAGNTDCLFLSVGWAQYDPRSLSVKSLRHTGPIEEGGRWSRQSEELPVHRAIDLTLLAAAVLRASSGTEVHIPAGTLENQPTDIPVTLRFGSEAESRVFQSLVTDPLLLRRWAALRDTLNQLAEAGLI